MLDKKKTWIPDIAYEIHPNAPWIDLEQNMGSGETVTIRLHRAHLRILLEEVGMLASPLQADEFTKAVCEKLCQVYLEMKAEYHHLSHQLEDVFERLDGFLDAIPSEYWPSHLWANEDEKREPKQSAPAESVQPFTLEPSP